MNILMLLVALALSAIAAFYSIAGLAAIFAAAVIPIVVMGSILEISKLVVASWLYRNWDDLPKLMKSYFLSAVIILMCLTSMGIFGFLSKAHSDQSVPTGDIQAKISLIDEKINIEKETINEARATLSQLDKQVNETLSRTTNDTTTKSVDRSISIRKGQSKERKQLYDTISTSQAEVAKLQQEKAPIAGEARRIEAEVGPIRYIAALIYGDQIDQNILEKAVRFVIIMIVSVFDPLAVLMLVGYNWTLKHRKKEEETREGWHQEWVPNTESPWADWDDKPTATEDFNPRPDDIIKEFVDSQVTDDTPIASKDLWDLYEEEPRVDPIESWNNKIDEKQKLDIDESKALDEEIIRLFNGDDDYIASPPPPLGITTIEQEVEDLQKPVDYDSAGRLITPRGGRAR